MIEDKNTVPKDTYNKLCSYVGQEKANKYIKSIGYSYHGIMLLILYYELKTYFRKWWYFILLFLLLLILIFLLK